MALGRAALGGDTEGPGPVNAGPRAKGVIRLAHLTDIHVQPELRAEAGMAAALAHAQARGPDLILTGGDSVMDVFGAGRARADMLRRTFRDTLRRECGIPVHHVTGNHDIFGWDRKASGTTGEEADWGRKFACDLFGVPRTWHSFDHGGWRFVCLDSVQPKGSAYTAYVDDEQLAWLKATLDGTPASMPVCVASHIPVLSLTALTFGKPRGRDRVGEDTVIAHAEMHTDGTLLHDMFKASGKVRLCLSGHTHLVDRCMIDGVTYVCDGAVSGAWWKGPHEGIAEGYGLLELGPDGSVSHRYVPFGWDARP